MVSHCAAPVLLVLTGDTEVGCAPRTRTFRRRGDESTSCRGVHTSNVSTEENHRLLLSKIRLDQGAWAATAAMSAMLSPFLRDGTALMCKMTPETGARASSMSLPK